MRLALARSRNAIDYEDDAHGGLTAAGVEAFRVGHVPHHIPSALMLSAKRA